MFDNLGTRWLLARCLLLAESNDRALSMLAHGRLAFAWPRTHRSTPPSTSQSETFGETRSDRVAIAFVFRPPFIFVNPRIVQSGPVRM